MIVSLAAVFSIVMRYVTILKTAARETKFPESTVKTVVQVD